MNHYFKLYALASLIAGAVLYGYLTYVDGVLVNRPIQYISDPMNVQLQYTTYRPGEIINGYISFCKSKAVRASVSWTLTDGQVISLSAPPGTKLYGEAPLGCYYHVLFPIGVVPSYSTTDIAQLTGVVNFYVNPLHTVSFALKTQPLTITK